MHFRDSDGYYTSRHACFLLQYHLVLVTKYRHPVMVGDVRDAMKGYVQKFFDDRGMPVHAIDVEPDHLHVIFDASPQLELKTFINALKSASSRRIRADFPDDVSKFYWKPVFWSLSYFICAVSDRSADVVKHYIESQ